MSLINDALKKAQRQRAEEQTALPPMGGGKSGSGRQNGTQFMILVGAGAAVLIAVSVVITVHMLGDRSPATVPVAVVTIPKVSVLAPTPSVPVPIQPALKAQPSAPAPAPVTALAPVPSVPISNHEAVSPEAPAVVEASGPIISTDSLKSDEDIQAIVDKFKVSGVRSGGSKVLMNDHIVRLNEIVDRNTGLRLVKIEDDMLIFKDSKGTLYTKNF